MLPLIRLSADGLADAFRERFLLTAPTDGTGKRKVDGELASTRLGSTASEYWANERFRQTVLLVREFRLEWPGMTLLTGDDVDSISWLVDCALYTATRNRHTGDIYDMNPTCWAIWLIQNQFASKVGDWQTSTELARQKMSFEGLYRFLEAQHSRHDDHSLYDPTTRKLVKRYKLPFKKFTVPPDPSNLFKYKKGARRLSDWIKGCQETLSERERPLWTGLHEGIIAQQPPRLVVQTPMVAARQARRDATWTRVVARAARARPMRTAQEPTVDAQHTRDVVSAVTSESRAAGGSDGADQTSDEELERELEQYLAEDDDTDSASAAVRPAPTDQQQQQ